MRKAYLFLSVLLCVFTASFSYAQNYEDGSYGDAQPYSGEYGYAGQSYGGGEGCCPSERPVGDCYCLYCRYEPCYYNKWHCHYEPKYCYKRCCRQVPQYYQKQCCRYVPQYYCQTCCRYCPQYYTTCTCHYVPKYTCERCCRYVPRYYYKHTCQPTCCDNNQCAPQCAPACQ